MIRLDKRMAERLLIAYAYQKYSGNTIYTVGTFLRDRVAGGPFSAELTSALEGIFQRRDWGYDVDGDEASFEGDARIVLQQMEKLREGQSFIPIIEQLCGILQAPFTRNHLGSSTIRNLRRAILLPEERAGLETRLATREMTCVGCAKRLVSGEVVTFHSDAGGGGTYSLKCALCSNPEYISCSHEGCGTVENIPARIKKYFQKGWTCAEHTTPAGATTVRLQEPDLRFVEPPQWTARVFTAAVPNTNRTITFTGEDAGIANTIPVAPTPERLRAAAQRPRTWEEIRDDLAGTNGAAGGRAMPQAEQANATEGGDIPF